MFGILKKKLKEVISKVSGRIDKEEYKEMPAPQPGTIESSMSIETNEPSEQERIETEKVLENEKKDMVKDNDKEKLSSDEKQDLIDELVETDQKIEQEISKKVEELKEFEETVEKEIKEEKRVLEDVEEKHDAKLIHEIEEEIKEEKKIVNEIDKEKQELEEIEKKIDEEKKSVLAAEIEPKKKSILERILPMKTKKLSELSEAKKIIVPEPVVEPDKPIKQEPIIKITKSVVPEKPTTMPQTISIKVDEKSIDIVEKAEPSAAELVVEKKGFFTKIKEKTLSEDDIKDILADIRHALLENDVALDVSDCIINDLKKELIGRTISRGRTEEVIENAMKNAVLGVLSQERIDLDNMLEQAKEPLLVIFLGFNGVGKTTVLSKIAHRYKKYKPILAAGDTFRAASIEQLEEHSKNIGADLVKHRYGADSAAVIFDAKKHAAAADSKLVLADTAGRAHTNANLMDELKKICRVNKPDLKILVLDALTGNDIYEQARLFDQAVGVDAIILTKTDVYEKGGSALSAAYTIKKPILFLGTGQNYGDLKEFSPEEIVKNLLG